MNVNGLTVLFILICTGVSTILSVILFTAIAEAYYDYTQGIYHSTKKIIFTIITLSILLGLSFGSLISVNRVGGTEGEHSGYITRIESRNNLIWNATLVYFKSDTESTQENVYCVNNDVLKNKLEEYAQTKQRVTIKYKRPFVTWRKICNGGESIIHQVGG